MGALADDLRREAIRVAQPVGVPRSTPGVPAGPSPIVAVEEAIAAEISTLEDELRELGAQVDEMDDDDI